MSGSFDIGSRVRFDPAWPGTAERAAKGLPSGACAGTVTKLLSKSEYHAPDSAWVDWDDGNRRPAWLAFLVPAMAVAEACT